MPSLLDRAILIAVEAHSGQVDKAGEPYILHCLRVMCDPSLTSEEERIVGVLHDVREDHPAVWDRYSSEFSFDIASSLRLLDKLDREQSYSAYIRRIAESGNLTAIKVKLVDLRDNTSPFRLRTEIPPVQFKRYQDAKKVLSEAYNSLVRSSSDDL